MKRIIQLSTEDLCGSGVNKEIKDLKLSDLSIGREDYKMADEVSFKAENGAIVYFKRTMT